MPNSPPGDHPRTGDREVNEGLPDSQSDGRQARLMASRALLGAGLVVMLVVSLALYWLLAGSRPSVSAQALAEESSPGPSWTVVEFATRGDPEQAHVDWTQVGEHYRTGPRAVAVHPRHRRRTDRRGSYLGSEHLGCRSGRTVSRWTAHCRPDDHLVDALLNHWLRLG